MIVFFKVLLTEPVEDATEEKLDDDNKREERLFLKLSNSILIFLFGDKEVLTFLLCKIIGRCSLDRRSCLIFSLCSKRSIAAKVSCSLRSSRD